MPTVNLCENKGIGHAVITGLTLAAANTENRDQLQNLALSETGISSTTITAEAAEWILSLTSIDLGDNSIANNGLKALATAYAKISDNHLEKIDLGGNGITAESFTTPQAAIFLHKIKTVDIGSNPIGNEGLKHFLLLGDDTSGLGVIVAKSKIEFLVVSNCALTAAAVPYIVTFVEQSPCLKNLYLCKEEVGEEGWAQINEAIEHKKSLGQEIDLREISLNNPDYYDDENHNAAASAASSSAVTETSSMSSSAFSTPSLSSLSSLSLFSASQKPEQKPTVTPTAPREQNSGHAKRPLPDDFDADASDNNENNDDTNQPSKRIRLPATETKEVSSTDNKAGATTNSINCQN